MRARQKLFLTDMSDIINITDDRAVHLDFHTSELIEDVGKDFDGEEFKKALKKSDITSITLFAKCHHGCFYYKDSAFFVHPHLHGNLLDEQLKACKEIGVTTRIYISAGYDEYIAKRHPEWVQVYKKGEVQPADGFRRLCFNNGYLDILKAQTEEVLKKYHPSGVFFDIISDYPCFCENCLADMKKKGLNPDNEQDVKKQAADTLNRYYKVINETVKSICPSATIIHNSDLNIASYAKINACTRLEIESLPTGGWGYDHFPFLASYMRRQNKQYLGMTGKFHRGWGEFGGYKYPDALLYETALDLAYGAGMIVGDQLHPCGKTDGYTYDIIGKATRFFNDRKKWSGGEFKTELALFTPCDCDGRYGAARILLEDKYLFDVIDENEISAKYPLIVMGGDCELSDALSLKIKNYVDRGGKIIATGKTVAALIKVGVDLGCDNIVSDSETPCYFEAGYPLAAANGVPLVIYGDAYSLSVTGEVLCDKFSPYFKRAGEKFSSHLHTPCDYSKKSAAITLGKNGIALAADLFALYFKDGGLTAKVLITPLISQLLNNEKVVQTDFPSSGKITLCDKGSSYVLHLAYANTVVRGSGNKMIETIEDIVTLDRVNVKLKIEKPKSIVLQPDGENIDFRYKDGYAEFAVNGFKCYAAVEIVKE